VDVTAIDVLAFKQIDAIKQAEETCPKPELFDEIMKDVKFEVVGSDAILRPLMEGGENISLTWKNRKQFVDLLRKYRLSEFSSQCLALKRGLATVVPQSFLSIFSWRELEVQVCGRGITNAEIDLLERITTYNGCGASDAHIKMFWEMMRFRFSEEDRARFFVFTWGRSRLPTLEADYGQRFQIYMLNRNKGAPDDWYPLGHTCGFYIELPRYTNINSMTKRVLWAINNSAEIDADSSEGRGTVTVAGGDSDDDDATLF